MSRQSCRQNINRLRLHRSYKLKEVAKVLGVHVRSVQIWHKKGLKAIDENERPLLFLGSVVKTYLKSEQKSRKYKLKPHECNCLKCRSAVSPDFLTVFLEVTDKQIGKNLKSIIIRGKCPVCSSKVIRFASSRSIYDTPWWVKFKQAEKRLKGTSRPTLNTDIKEG